MIKLQKPFLKWVGGKTQIIHNILDKIPDSMNNYHEMFTGGGSVLLAVLSLQKENKIIIKNNIYAYDININLINVYKNVQNNKEKLYNYIFFYIKEYDSITNGNNITNRNPNTIEEAKTSKESYYYYLRNKYNELCKSNVSNDSNKNIECSALFIFLNKTCFRGLYRESPNGFNVPFGHYKKTPSIITKEELYCISDLIKNVIFVHNCFTKVIHTIKKGDFVYLDPPYAPINDKSFVNYVSDGFNLELHKKLFEEVKSLNNKNIKFLMSNSKVKLVLDNFGKSNDSNDSNDSTYNCEDIKAKRAINSKNPESTVTEVLIYN